MRPWNFWSLIDSLRNQVTAQKRLINTYEKLINAQRARIKELEDLFAARDKLPIDNDSN